MFSNIFMHVDLRYHTDERFHTKSCGQASNHPKSIIKKDQREEKDPSQRNLPLPCFFPFDAEFVLFLKQ